MHSSKVSVVDACKRLKTSNLPDSSVNDEPKAGELIQSSGFTNGNGDIGKETIHSDLFNKFIFEAVRKSEPKSKMGLTLKTPYYLSNENQYEIINGPSETSSQMSSRNAFDNFMFMFGII